MGWSGGRILRETGVKRGGFRGFRGWYVRDLGGKSDASAAAAPRRFRDARPGHLLEERRQLRQNLVQDGGGHAFQPAPVAGAKIEGAGLIASGSRRWFSSPRRERPAKRPSAEASAGGDRQHHGGFGQPVESGRRDHQNRARALLLMPGGGIERNQVNVAALH